MKFHWIGLLLLTLFFTPGVRANPVNTYTYSYTGNTFDNAVGVYSTGDSIHGYFVVDAPLASDLPFDDFLPNFFSYTDGHGTVDSTNYITAPGYATYYISTDSNGSVLAWSFQIVTGDHTILTINTPGGNQHDGGYRGFDLNNNGENSGNPGVWTLTVSATSVPEPPTGISLSFALLVTAVLAQNRARRVSKP